MNLGGQHLNNEKPKANTFPPQHQNHQPGTEGEMHPSPISVDNRYRGSEKLKDKVAVITGGDSGIGKSVSIYFAKEGADVVIVYFNEDQDATKTKQLVEKEGRKCMLLAGDIGNEDFCKSVIEQTLSKFGKIDILVNNAAEQHPQKSIIDITAQQLERTFRTNIFS